MYKFKRKGFCQAIRVVRNTDIKIDGKVIPVKANNWIVTTESGQKTVLDDKRFKQLFEPADTEAKLYIEGKRIAGSL